MAMPKRSPVPAQVRLYHSTDYYTQSAEYFGSDGASDPAPAPAAKRGGLRALVSKFESMASGKKAPDPPIIRQTGAVGTKGRGWLGAVGLNPKKKEELQQQENSEASRQRTDSLDFARSTRADEIKLERKEKDVSEGSVKSQNSLIQRGKKEGMRLLNGLSGRKNRESRSGDKAEQRSNRRESLVQIRVRALETAKASKVTKDRPSLLRDEVTTAYRAPSLPNGSDNINDLSPVITSTQGLREGQGDRQRQKLQKPQPISSKPNTSSTLIPQEDTAAEELLINQMSPIDDSAKKGNVLKKKNPSSQARNRSQTSSEPSVHDFEGDPRTHVPSEAQVFSLAARPDHGAPRKSVAPSIRERLQMFEAAKEEKGTSIVALLGAGATAALKRRIADEGAEEGAEVKDIMKRVEYGRSDEKLQSPQTGWVEESGLSRGSTQRRHSKSPASRYLEERKRSSIGTQGSGDYRLNGKYVSSFAGRHSDYATPETTRAVFQAVKATTHKKSELTARNGSISPPAKLGKLVKAARVVSRADSPTLSPALQDMVMRRQSERNALSAATSRRTSRQPSPHSMDGHNSLSKRSSYAQLFLTGGPVRGPTAVPVELIAPPAAPTGTPPGTIDDRVAELIALAAEDDEPIISKGVAEDYHEIERLGSAMGGMKEVPIGPNQHLQPAKFRAPRTSQQTRVSVAARNVGPRVRTPLSHSRSSISRMLGRDGPAADSSEKKDEISPVASSGENKENIPSDEDSIGGKEKKEKTKDEMRRISEIRWTAEEGKTLVVRSEVAIREPKPLRLVEISRMLRMARFGRSRSGGRSIDFRI